MQSHVLPSTEDCDPDIYADKSSTIHTTQDWGLLIQFINYSLYRKEVYFHLLEKKFYIYHMNNVFTEEVFKIKVFNFCLKTDTKTQSTTLQ